MQTSSSLSGVEGNGRTPVVWLAFSLRETLRERLRSASSQRARCSVTFQVVHRAILENSADSL